MEILSHVEGFEWDNGNVSKNWEKHRVSYTECEEVFFNSPLVAGIDEKHSEGKNRFYLLGRTDNERLLFIVFTRRGKKIRVISARDMNRKERKIHYEQIEKDTEIQK